MKIKYALFISLISGWLPAAGAAPQPYDDCASFHGQAGVCAGTGYCHYEAATATCLPGAGLDGADVCEQNFRTPGSCKARQSCRWDYKKGTCHLIPGADPVVLQPGPDSDPPPATCSEVWIPDRCTARSLCRWDRTADLCRDRT